MRVCQFRHTCVFSHIFTRLRVPRRSISLHPQALLYQMPLRMSILRSRIFRSSHKCRSTGEITESLCRIAYIGSSRKKENGCRRNPANNRKTPSSIRIRAPERVEGSLVYSMQNPLPICLSCRFRSRSAGRWCGCPSGSRCAHAVHPRFRRGSAPRCRSYHPC